MNNNKISTELENFIEDIRWKYPFQLKSESRIEQDLKITGDEAVEFIIKFGEKFDVDVSEFMAEDYFNSEGDFFLISILNFLFKTKKETPKKILTLGDLEEAIKIGKLE